MFSNKQAGIISDFIYDTLKQCKTPEERAVIIKLNSNIVKQWDKKNMKLEQCNLIVNSFERETEERKQTAIKNSEFEQRNLLYSNPTIGWARKNIASKGAVLIHTNIRPSLLRNEGYEWGTLKLDQAEFDKRINIINKIIAKNGMMSPLQDDDLLEEIF